MTMNLVKTLEHPTALRGVSVHGYRECSTQGRGGLVV